jgi:hypothetical protein
MFFSLNVSFRVRQYELSMTGHTGGAFKGTDTVFVRNDQGFNITLELT